MGGKLRHNKTSCSMAALVSTTYGSRVYHDSNLKTPPHDAEIQPWPDITWSNHRIKSVAMKSLAIKSRFFCTSSPHDAESGSVQDESQQTLPTRLSRNSANQLPVNQSFHPACIMGRMRRTLTVLVSETKLPSGDNVNKKNKVEMAQNETGGVHLSRRQLCST